MPRNNLRSEVLINWVVHCVGHLFVQNLDGNFASGGDAGSAALRVKLWRLRKKTKTAKGHGKRRPIGGFKSIEARRQEG